MLDRSGLVMWSYGVVVKDKESGSDVIHVTPIEQLNLQADGLISEQKKEFKGKEGVKNGFKTEVSATNYVIATWLPNGINNRITAPDVYANETVMLYKFANVNEYFWTTLFREPSIRRLEDVLYSYSNIPKGLDEFDDKSSYWMRVSTKTKIIKLHTSNNDGELTTYDITINTKEGFIEIKDGHDNYIKLDSSVDDVSVTTKRDINIKAGRDITLTADRDIVTKAMGSTTMSSGKDHSVSSTNYSNYASSTMTLIQPTLISFETAVGSYSGALSVTTGITGAGGIFSVSPVGNVVSMSFTTSPGGIDLALHKHVDSMAGMTSPAIP